MNKRLITFATDDMSIGAKVCAESGLRNNFDRADMYGPGNIDENFVKKNKSILSKERGAGYWLWKPYFILNTMKEMREGDILMYADAGVEIINNINWITDRMDSDIFLFGNMYQHLHWCKMDVIKAISPKATFDKQVQASVVIFRVSEWSIEFVKRWLDYCERPGYIDDSKSSSQNHPEFREHRHDQAVLTCLAYRMGIPLHWWPAVYNGGMFTYDHAGYNDNYPAIFHHHRMRNSEFLEFRRSDVIRRDMGVNDVKNIYIRKKGYKIFNT